MNHGADSPLNPAATASASPVYLAAAGDAGEATRALGISLLGIDTEMAVTFLPAGEVVKQGKSWDRWLQRVFSPILAEHFWNVYHAAIRTDMGGVVSLDAELTERLSRRVVRRSVRAGEALLEGKHEARHLVQWRRLIAALEQGQCPGHAVTLFAVQCALFHVPLLSGLLSYVYFEWRSGFAAAGDSPEFLSVDHFQASYAGSITTVREAFEKLSRGGGSFRCV